MSNYGKSKQLYTTFGPFYEVYLYAFTLGFHSGKRNKIDENEKLETFNVVKDWAKDHFANKKDIF
ncbi:MAG: hypothetical protein RBR53_08065 [Desulforegulaceae bacterium]|nr:hypothetical protein [Desulforegulaceae bacterium]